MYTYTQSPLLTDAIQAILNSEEIVRKKKVVNADTLLEDARKKHVAEEAAMTKVCACIYGGRVVYMCLYIYMFFHISLYVYISSTASCTVLFCSVQSLYIY